MILRENGNICDFIADTYSEAKSIAEEAERRQIPVSVNQNFRKHHKFDFIRGLIQEGIVGKLEGIHFSSPFYRQDKGWRVNTGSRERGCNML